MAVCFNLSSRLKTVTSEKCSIWVEGPASEFICGILYEMSVDNYVGVVGAQNGSSESL